VLLSQNFIDGFFEFSFYLSSELDMRRLFRLAYAIEFSPLLNLRINEEIVLDPQAPLGIISDQEINLQGFPKRELRVGLGLPGWGEGFQYPRCVVGEFNAALMAIDSALLPDKNDIFLGFLDPISFYKLSTQTNAFFLDTQVSSAPQSVSSFPGLKVLLVGDTHHGFLSLYNALSYCLKEAWDAVLLCHQSSHIDWFRSVLGQNRVFIYHLKFSSDQLRLSDSRKIPPSERTFQELTFHGEFSHLHPRRSAIHVKLSSIQPEKIYRHVGRLEMQEWINVLPSEAAVLCGCLNNQISINHIYSMLNGCLLFSDAFHSANGWGKFFRDGESYVLYESAAELIELYLFYRANPIAASRIACRGRELVEANFTLTSDCHPWLLAESADQLRSELQSSTQHLECQGRDPVRWNSLSQLEEDLAVYQLLHDLCTFYSSIRWVTGERDSVTLIRAVLEQVPRCLVGQMLLLSSGHEVSPVLMTRLPSDRELMSLSVSRVACLLVLLRPDELPSEDPSRLEIEVRLRRQNVLNWSWLGNHVHRQNMTIQMKARLTPHACWPLPSGWHGLLIYHIDELREITPLY
jgi:hypothetical protein